MKLNELAYAACMEPDEAAMAEHEVRSFLNAHFFCARLLTKVLMAGETPPNERSMYMVAAYKRFEFLKNFAPGLMERKQCDFEEFQEEFNICKEMVDLLPSKLDRINQYNESPTLM